MTKYGKKEIREVVKVATGLENPIQTQDLTVRMYLKNLTVQGHKSMEDTSPVHDANSYDKQVL